MKFGKYVLEKQRAEWSDQYVDYKGLKDLIKESAAEEATAGVQSFSPRTTSLTVQRAADRRDSAEERFFQKLESEVDKCGKFTARLVSELRERLKQLQGRVRAAPAGDEPQRELLLEASPGRGAGALAAGRREHAAPHAPGPLAALEAKSIGDEFLQLEKYVNLNYMGFHKILKKHDKMLPHSPCRQFYISHLHNQPWVQGNYSDLLVVLSSVYSDLRGDASAAQADDSSQGMVRSTTKYWVRMSDVSTVKHHILQHLPVFQFNQGRDFTGDAQLVNSGGRRGGGDESQKERFGLREEQVLMYLDGDLPEEAIQQEMRQASATEEDIARVSQTFVEVQKTVDAKQLKPMVRTQYMRTAFQIPFDPTVRISLDTNLCMIKENPEDGPTTASAGRWYRDPTLPIHRTEITRFPHAVLEVKLSMAEGEEAPDWVAELVDSGLLTEVHKFSKYIHGTATLFPDMVQAVPYWVDDESGAGRRGSGGGVRASMLMSAPEQPADVAPDARDQEAAARTKPRKRLGDEEDDEDEIAELREPLLARQSLISSARIKTAERRANGKRAMRQAPQAGWRERLLEWWFSKPPMAPRPVLVVGAAPPAKIEPKTFFANERTFLSWLHMAVTIGSIATALLGFSGSAKGGDDPGSGLIEFIACVLLPVAILMCGYALLLYVWRTGQIRDKSATLYDDRRGPLGLAAVIVVALSLIFLVSLADLISTIEHHGDAPPAPGPAGPAAPTAAAAASVLRAGVDAAGAAARSLLGRA
ncbi:hypothetical protein CHLNCDRAFT_58814 [Chlorella variabilis]|uniref:SPX domain-containing protein n=1 Tax=Chlorella variabilis TaxID=554065 RepID=E1ZNI3_CHLVA|nr:hypothetical protein CHLNCDRAFT_58814 [Chlorella variabilis]EFN52611.1 hypothetical protein CHLNCDRAFT_58814 [Chlorella variabilis]|eukprot:XP_005844713.1 hypothetical protein CHLNCDRAFT_58814 [Chlorella variabilis]